MKPTLYIFLAFLLTGITGISQVTFTNSSGLLGVIPSGGSNEDCAVDMNGDHLDDIVRVYSGNIHVDYQLADGTFDAVNYPLEFNYPPTWSICAADIDENGYTDLLFGNGSRVSFVYAADDGESFSVDEFPEYIFSQRSTFADINNDGAIDAFVCHDVDESHPYRNDGNGNMILDQEWFPTLDVGGNYAAIWCDYDNDWDIDLYVTKCRGGAAWGDPQRINLLYRNNGDGTYTEVGEEANMDDGNQSWTTVFEDFDNDGDFDAFTVNHSSFDVPGGAANKFMRNNGDGTFTDIIITTGIDPDDLGAWNCDAGDFDNNGFIDIFSEMSDELYLNNGDGTFTTQDLSFDSGGIGDFNDDGFLDVISGNSLWLNDGNDNNYVKVGLEGILSNSNGIGARIEIHGEFGVQIREIRAGESFAPMSSLDEHFGLGTYDSIAQMIVRWPSGVVTVINDPDINTTHIIPEAECLLEPSDVSADGATSFCEGGSVLLTAIEADTYLWNTGDTVQSIMADVGGNYSVVTWDSLECVSVSNAVFIDILEDVEPEAFLLGESVFCEGESTTISSSNGLNHEWNNGDLGQTIEVSESGEYFVMTDGVCSDEPLSSNSIEVSVIPAADTPIAANVSILEEGTAMLEAEGENILWYDDEFADTPIGEGNSFETEFFTDEITYWCESVSVTGGDAQTGGKPDDFGGGGVPSTGGVLFFDAFENFTLVEVTVYVDESSPGVKTIFVNDANEDLIAEMTTEYLEEGEHTIALDFNIPAGDGHRIGCSENDLFRNNGGVLYPYEIGTVGAITTSTYGGGYYYYFYNWQIETEKWECPSERIPVTASVGIDELTTQGQMAIFPNPFTDNVRISFFADITSTASFDVFDVSGKLVFCEASKTIVSGYNEIQLALDALSSGIYSIRITMDNGYFMHKLVKE